MPTRHAQPNDQTRSYERHMSSPIYADRRPIPANIVAEKAAGYRSPADRRLLFFLQALSVEDGGLRGAAADIEQSFPEVGNCAFARLDPKLQFQIYLQDGEREDFDGTAPVYGLLIDLCTDPALDLEDMRKDAAGRQALDSIEQFRQQWIAREKAAHVTTSFGGQVAEMLDQASSLGGITIVEAAAGAGKTEESKVWQRSHLGEAYFITLSGITTRTNLMQAIGTALGLATCQRKASELQAKIETFFRRTGAFLIIDEAHFLWPQSKRISSNPELIDWIDTLVNMGARIALICTDQFARQKDRVEKQTAWTSDQFRRRVREHRILDGPATLEDLELVTRHLLSFGRDAESERWAAPLADKHYPENVDMLVLGAHKSVLPMSTARKLVEKAQYLAGRDGRDRVAPGDILAALEGEERSELTLTGVARQPARKLSATAAALPLTQMHVPPDTTISAPSRTQQMSRLSTVLPARSARRQARVSDLETA